MFWVWFGLAAITLVRPVRRAWIETLTCAALAFAAVPLVSALTTDRGLLDSFRAGDGVFLGFDIAMLAAAALCGAAALQAARRSRPPPTRLASAPRSKREASSVA